MHINISITAAGNGAYNNFCNVLKFKRFMLWCGDQVTPILPGTWNQCFINILLQWYWRLAVQCGETDDEGGILKWWSTFILLRRINTWSVLPFIRGFWYSYTYSYIGHWRLVIFFLFWSIHLIFMENFINVIMKRNKFHAMTYPPRQTFMPQWYCSFEIKFGIIWI